MGSADYRDALSDTLSKVVLCDITLYEEQGSVSHRLTYSVVYWLRTGTLRHSNRFHDAAASARSVCHSFS